eukprot:3896412-Pyramimonas_sp.AAC.1
MEHLKNKRAEKRVSRGWAEKSDEAREDKSFFHGKADASLPRGKEESPGRQPRGPSPPYRPRLPHVGPLTVRANPRTKHTCNQVFNRGIHCKGELVPPPSCPTI